MDDFGVVVAVVRLLHDSGVMLGMIPTYSGNVLDMFRMCCAWFGHDSNIVM